MALRGKIREICEAKKAHVDTLTAEEAADQARDVISLIMKDEVYANSFEDAVDDVIVMFLAGSKTV